MTDMYDEKTVFATALENSPRLFALWGDEMHIFPLQGRQVMGRPSNTNRPDIAIPIGTVSRRHGEFITNPGYCAYVDLGSGNGTYLNGKKLVPGEYTELRDGDRLQLRGKDANSDAEGILLIYSTSYRPDTEWERLALDDSMAEIQIGRMDRLRLNDQSVSRHHASLFLAKRGWAVIDQDSLNGVYVNNRRLREPVYLAPMDVIRIGGYLFVFTGNSLFYQTDLPGSAAVRGGAAGRDGSTLSISIEEKNVWHRMKKKTLLKDIQLEIPKGSFVLILGGSGAGKTTFMNAVMGYEPAEGVIRYKDTDIYAEYKKMKYEIGYVPQQDLLRLNDTVYDTLYNAANMRLPKGMTPEQYREQVERTMRVMGLEREQSSLVGKISGGQRKRLSIAVEYIGNPSLFFLDEPDSGLDGTMSRALMENLRQIADEGKIVIVISHSPDRAADLFDQVIVLGKHSEDDSGRLVYYGSPKDACEFFGVDQMEHIVKRINRIDEGGEGRADYYIEKFKRQEMQR